MPKTKSKKPVKRTPTIVPEAAAVHWSDVVILDDPQRQTFESGAVRSALRIRYDLLPPAVVNAYRKYHSLRPGRAAILPAELIAMELLADSGDGHAENSECFLDCLFSIGALIHFQRSGKLSLDTSRHAIAAYAEAMTEGSDKYGDDNWLKGMPERSLVQHAANHLFWFAACDNSEDHLAHAFWNVAAVIYFHKNIFTGEFYE